MTGGPMQNYGRQLRQWPDVDSMLAHLETMRQRNDEVLAAFASAREEVGDLASEGVSEDGSVRVALDDDGTVTAVEFDDSAMGRLSHLGRMIVSAVHQAQAAHALKMAELAARIDGSINVVSMVNESIPSDVRDSLSRRDQQRY